MYLELCSAAVVSAVQNLEHCYNKQTETNQESQFAAIVVVVVVVLLSCPR